jgi:hypothetical protein
MLHLYMIQTIFGVRSRLCKLQKGCTPLAAASDKAYQLLANVRRFSPGTPPSSTNKTCRHDIAEILLKVALSTKQSNQTICVLYCMSSIWTGKHNDELYAYFLDL